MIPTDSFSTNQQRVTKVKLLLEDLLLEVLQRGFYGVAAIELSVQDGTIQNIHRKVEQIHR